MKATSFRWNALAAALVSAAGLTLMQLAAPGLHSQDQEPQATEKRDSKSETKDQANDQTKRRSLSKFMRMKLDASQNILEGLAVEDYELIQQGAIKLEEMSAAEKWRVTNDAFFREHSADFQQIAKRLVKNAKDEKLEAAALTWLQATMQCIECHKWSRANLMAEQPARTRIAE